MAKKLGIPILFRYGWFLTEAKKRPGEHSGETILGLYISSLLVLLWGKVNADKIMAERKVTRREFMKLVGKVGLGYLLGSTASGKWIEMNKILKENKYEQLPFANILSALTAAVLEKYSGEKKREGPLKEKPTIYVVFDCLSPTYEAPKKLQNLLINVAERRDVMAQYKKTLEAEMEERPDFEHFQKHRQAFYTHNLYKYAPTNGRWSEEITTFDIFE